MNGYLDISPLTVRLGHPEMLTVTPEAWAALGGDPQAGPRITEVPPAMEQRVDFLLRELAQARADGNAPASLRATVPGTTGPAFTFAIAHLGHCGVWQIQLA